MYGRCSICIEDCLFMHVCVFSLDNETKTLKNTVALFYNGINLL